MYARHFSSILGAVLGAAACGGGSSPAGSAGSVDGTVKGNEITVADAISFNVGSADPHGVDNEGLVLLTDAAGACDRLTNNTSKANATTVFIAMTTLTVSGGTITSAFPVAGTYTIGAQTGNVAQLKVTRKDVYCQSLAGQSDIAVSGTVTLTSATDGVYDGTFDVTLMGGDHVTGTFAPMGCATANAGSATTCSP